MHAIPTIHALEQRRADNAEAQRILRANGDHTTQVHGIGGRISEDFDVPHDAGHDGSKAS